eukprot:jgi/Chrzof1/11628/Cz06g02240.t1
MTDPVEHAINLQKVYDFVSSFLHIASLASLHKKPMVPTPYLSYMSSGLSGHVKSLPFLRVAVMAEDDGQTQSFGGYDEEQQ